MNIAEIIAKAAKGEELSDEEKTFATEFDFQKQIDDSAAAARRKAEERLSAADQKASDLEKKVEELTAQVEDAGNAGKSDLEKAQAKVESLTGQVAERDQQIADLTAANAQAARDKAIDGILTKSGIQFVDGVDAEMMKSAFAARFAEVSDDDLGAESVVNPIIDAYKGANKATIVDNSGHGSGGGGHDGGSNPPSSSGEKTPDQMSTEERASYLRNRS